MVKPVFLDLDFSPILSADYTSIKVGFQHPIYKDAGVVPAAYTGTAIKVGFQQPVYKDQGITLPESYCFENTKLYMLWWDNSQIDYNDIGKQLGMEVVTVSSIMQEPGCVIPYHFDNFNSPIWDQTRVDQVVRVIICLEDYKMGHLIQYITNDKCRTCVDWVAGDGIMWGSHVYHLTANAGMQPKYTMQITGFVNK